jgi:hypothetical protein
MKFRIALATLLTMVTFAAMPQTVPSHDVNITWRNATLFTDDTPIPPSDPAVANSLASTSVRFGTCNAAGDAIAVARDLITVPSTQLSLLATGLPDGTFCFQAQHTTFGGVKSEWTAVVSKVLAPVLKKPKRPTNVVLS